MLGLAVLVVEEEYLVAAEMEATLLAHGAANVVIARDLADVGSPVPAVDLAIIEAQLGSPANVAFAATLNAAGIPTVVTSADRAIGTLFTGSIPLEKPFDDHALLAACEAARRLGRPLDQV